MQAEDVIKLIGKLTAQTEWEVSFINSCKDALAAGNKLTAKQLNVLARMQAAQSDADLITRAKLRYPNNRFVAACADSLSKYKSLTNAKRSALAEMIESNVSSSTENKGLSAQTAQDENSFLIQLHSKKSAVRKLIKDNNAKTVEDLVKLGGVVLDANQNPTAVKIMDCVVRCFANGDFSI